MATGAPGTNGVWQYGEDDSEATFSALLNKVASTADTQIGTDRGRLTTLEARKISGLVPVIPTSLNNTAGSASFNSTTGEVTFTNIQVVSLNGCFTSAYKNYRVLIYDLSASLASLALKTRLRQAGIDSTGSYYQAGVAEVVGGAPSAYSINNGGWWDMYPPQQNVSFGSVSADIINPQLAVRTAGNFSAIGYNSGVGMASCGLLHDALTIYDGLTILTNTGSGTFTGKMKVFGYN